MRNIFAILIAILLIGCASKKQLIVSEKNKKIVLNSKNHKNYSKSKILYLVDGKIASNKDVKNMDSNDIKTITVIKGKENVAKYTKKKYDGVIIIEMKKN